MGAGMDHPSGDTMAGITGHGLGNGTLRAKATGRKTATVRRSSPRETEPAEGLRLVDTCEVFWFDSERDSWTIGAQRGCDLIIAESHISRVHCTIGREGERVFVRDNHSKNGTSINGAPCEVAELVIDSKLMLGATLLIGVSRRSQAIYDRLRHCMGRAPEHLSNIRTAMLHAKHRTPLLLVGEPGLEPQDVAQLLHDSSSATPGPFVVMPAEVGGERDVATLLRQAELGTLYSDLSELTHFSRLVSDALTSGDSPTRFVAASNSRATAVRLLGDELGYGLRTISLPPLRERKGELPALISTIFEDISVSGARIPLISESDLDLLSAYEWPKNLAELRRTLGYLVALSTHGSTRMAGESLGVPRSTLKNRLKRIGLDASPRPLRPRKTTI